MEEDRTAAFSAVKRFCSLLGGGFNSSAIIIIPCFCKPVKKTGEMGAVSNFAPRHDFRPPRIHHIGGIML